MFNFLVYHITDQQSCIRVNVLPNRAIKFAASKVSRLGTW
jgi:hypothetical protein